MHEVTWTRGGEDRETQMALMFLHQGLVYEKLRWPIPVIWEFGQCSCPPTLCFVSLQMCPFVCVLYRNVFLWPAYKTLCTWINTIVPHSYPPYSAVPLLFSSNALGWSGKVAGAAGTVGIPFIFSAIICLHAAVLRVPLLPFLQPLA